ncbi:LLM class flavin-dependent oxidoreductase [Acidiferrimicrobium sp. IK]|uniref:LLM class flavin-dependent oxidoreductase n=1 Tax=Acidiferrimicrobium sp. IK TaxID=2871700 RepID=UPI0021CB327E|nr:LLM class flavin-dependent oxidoreductase [Acidiferrimicrobium sp. IK]MCU4183181.1 LLM class flavin-dependent oxidoreductase [Acidiferrimicrobium sp. IK]
MRIDLHFYGMVPMSDAGAGAPAPTDRRATNDAVAAGYANLCHWAATADPLGYDTMWLTEHHFQYEGYEVTPNLILFGVHLAGLTERLRFGQLFNVVPQWHPLRLAEDFAMADILTGGRLVFGVGRGTVPREAQTLGAVVASGDNAMSREADRVNREMFEEAMEVIRAAWSEEEFNFTGKHYTFPPPGIPDRGATVTHLTLVPRPVHGPIEIFQAVSSPATLTYVASQGITGVFAMAPYGFVKANWDRFADAAADAGRVLAPGEGRCFQIPVHAARTTAEAARAGRPGHDEFVKFLAPYGRFKTIVEGSAFDYRPTMEETVGAGAMAIGSVEQVADTLGRWAELLDLRHLILFPDLPGLSREALDDQLHLLAEDVLPRIGVRLDAVTP